MLDIMKKYKNISNQRLCIDCISHTIYMESNNAQFLPISRDVRHNLRIGNLIVVRERIEETKSLNKELPKIKLKKQWKSVKNEKPDSNLEKMETE